MSRTLHSSFFLAALLWTLSVGRCHAQWITESFALKAGWNAVYFNVDASHATIDQLVGNDPSVLVEEIWMWAPDPTAAQFVTSPAAPSQPTYWLNWVRNAPQSATLTRLPGNAAFLVRASADYTWNVKGKPVVPSYQWTSSGLNFIGFPTVSGVGAPSFDTFLTPVPELKVSAEIFAYAGGAMANNPVQVLDQTVTKVTRGQAFWIRSPEFNKYFGPFQVVFAGSAGVRFGDSSGQSSFRLRNLTAQDLTVTLTGVASETAPVGQKVVQGQVPVLIRGDINPATLTFPHVALAAGSKPWTLKPRGQPGSEIEVVIGVNRQLLTGSAGDLYASVLRFTDSLNATRVDVPVSAEVGSSAGLWVGGATVSSVGHFLKPYAKATNLVEMTNVLTRLSLAEGQNNFHYELDPATGRILVFGGDQPQPKTGSYLLDGPIKVDPGTVARSYPLRLIVHNDGANTKLLQKIYYGVGLGAQLVLATKESLLQPTQLASARRISAVHLPTGPANNPWILTGTMNPGSTLATTIETGFDDQSSNPFLHTYHPDHDNLDASFKSSQPRGAESYGIRRQVTLSITAPSTDFESLTAASSTLNGNYVEVITLLGSATPSKEFTVRGSFVLNRISDIATLTTN